MNLKQKFDKGYPIRTFSKITNAKGQEMFIQESMSLKDVEKLQLSIMNDVKDKILELKKRECMCKSLVMQVRPCAFCENLKEIFGDF